MSRSIEEMEKADFRGQRPHNNAILSISVDLLIFCTCPRHFHYENLNHLFHLFRITRHRIYEQNWQTQWRASAGLTQMNRLCDANGWNSPVFVVCATSESPVPDRRTFWTSDVSQSPQSRGLYLLVILRNSKCCATNHVQHRPTFAELNTHPTMRKHYLHSNGQIAPFIYENVNKTDGIRRSPWNRIEPTRIPWLYLYTFSRTNTYCEPNEAHALN